jgi:hypothetical protein
MTRNNFFIKILYRFYCEITQLLSVTDTELSRKASQLSGMQYGMSKSTLEKTNLVLAGRHHLAFRRELKL